MNARNYDKLMQQQISDFCKNGTKPKLLLHCCCAPCSSACLERLKDYFQITVFFYNPNIESGEYERRKNEIIRFIKQTGWADFIDCGHVEKDFYAAVKGYENEKEGGKRCEKCFELRLSKTSRTAEKNGYDFFTTTLTISPLKNADLINSIGERLQNTAKWLYSDFKKRDGYLQSTRLSKEYNLYRQNYCGCIFSRRASQNASESAHETSENAKNNRA